MKKVFPSIITASRATDIPAFHTQWFMNRLRAGYCVWENPFNSSQKQYISFEKCKVIVFWSKNPLMLMPFLAEIKARGYQFYFQYTLNDYEQEKLEPCLPKLTQRIATFQKLSESLGKHRVIWRYDPIIISNTLSVQSILARVEHLAEHLAPYTEKLVFSYVDWYKKTARALQKKDSSLRAPAYEEMQQFASGLSTINKNLKSPLVLATCAEALNLHALGIEHNRCVDPQLLLRLCPESVELHTVNAQPGIHIQNTLLPIAKALPKNTGQRKLCGCASSKDIGSYNTCMHFCEYCYANQSQKAVISKMNTISRNCEKL